jgi:hypothetical protein
MCSVGLAHKGVAVMDIVVSTGRTFPIAGRSKPRDMISERRRLDIEARNNLRTPADAWFADHEMLRKKAPLVGALQKSMNATHCHRC